MTQYSTNSITDVAAKTHTLTVTLKEASSSSLTIKWELENNISCSNHTLINISYKNLMGCPKKKFFLLKSSKKNDCKDAQSYNVSEFLDSDINHFTIRSLSLNSTYKLNVFLESFMCEKVIARSEVVFKTLAGE